MHSIRTLRSILAIGLACAAVVFAAPVASAQIPLDPQTGDVAPQTGNVVPAPAPLGLVRVVRLDAPKSAAGDAPAVASRPAATGFDWTEAGIASGSAVAALLLTAGLLATRRARRTPELAITD